MLDKRLEVLWAKEEYGKLRGVSRQTGQSVGHLVREAVRRVYLTPADDTRRRAGERLLSGEFGMDWPDWPTLKKELENRMVSELETH
jgi:hypothetical protein